MKAERDLAGFALPFAASVTAAVYAGTSLCGGISISATTATGLTMLLLLHPAHRRWNDRILWFLIFMAGISAGWLCGAASQLMEVSMLHHHGPVSSLALRCGSAMQEAIDNLPFADSDTNAIIKALLTGERADIPRKVSEAFRDSGASHILALSGMHLSIVYGILSRLLSILGNSPAAVRARSLLIVLTCGFYTLATGAGESIVRALIFILIGETARLTGRFRSTGSILFGALLIQLAVDPQSARSVGFQLSYAAMAGIAFIFPWLRRLWPSHDDPRKDPVRWIWNSAAMSLACQLTTGPLAFAYFGTFPTHFLLTNLIAVPLSGMIIPTAIMTLLLSCLGICPGIMLRATEMLVQALSAALSVIASM